jgi:hypothetical protein
MAQQIQQAQENDRSLGELFSELASETSQLVRQEVALAQAEITQKATRVGTQVGYLVVGGAIGYAGLLALIAGVIILLAGIISRVTGWTTFRGAWVAALIVGLVIAGVAYYLITSALTALKNTDIAPRQTIESVKEDAEWIKNQMS